MAALTLLKVTAGTGANARSYCFRGSPTLYTGAVATATGISVASPQEAQQIPHRVSDLLLAGALVRIAVTSGTTLNPKTTRMFCSEEKRATIRQTDAGLLGQTVGGSPVRSVRIPRDATYY